ncbi:MAG: hypothetical protein P0Y56_06705 [Candidatus Andeanibacterium colombiense]|uniref:Uncharacterized protein n=1 Tax=Candidatus Andeanibacterium colombiense TaxID=3121345 RepID=A0AAJ5X7T1_9SPHN|nr:MAG: hypothetical protein P0Y56_06705 [Sphingomonadaceae bacterium]
MRLPIALVLAVAAIPSAVAAADWKEVDRLTGDVAVELDQGSVSKVLDGANEVLQATFRRQMPTGIMESDVAIDCKATAAKLRGLRLVNGDKIYNQPVSPTLEYHPVSFGSADAIYYKALCGKDIAPPENYAAEAPPADAPAADTGSQ